MAGKPRTIIKQAARKAFLQSLSQHGIVGVACKVIGVSRDVMYRLRSEDAEFAKQWRDAQEDAADAFELLLDERVKKGEPSPVVSMGKVLDDPDNPGKPWILRKFSDRLHELALKASRPEKFARPENGAIQALPQDLEPQPAPTPDDEAAPKSIEE